MAENAEEMHQALRIAKQLNKFIPLPNRLNWKVHESDVLHRGRALSLLRTKRSFFVPDDLSSLKSRSITVTRHGFMIIYEQQTLGLIVDLRAASHVFCTADKFKGRTGEYARCHVKIRLPRGNVHLFVRDGEVHKWSCAIMQATSLIGDKKNKKKHLETRILKVEAPEIKKEAAETPEDQGSTQSPVPVTVIERKAPEVQASEVPEVKSLTTVSVRSLREKLEKELVIRPKSDVIAEQHRRSKEPSFISSLFFPAPSEDVILEEDASEVFTEEQSIVMMSVEKEETEKPKKDWWNRSLRC